MSLGSFIKKQFIDILQWNEDADGVLAWRYPMQDFEIQYGGSLTVRESQVAVFVNEGKIADVFGPGMHKLTTQTLPVLTYLKNWDKLFESPFKSDVYFFSTRLQTGRKWGTPQAITLRDADFGMVRLRAFGMYSYGLVDARKFFTEISGTRAVYTRDDLEEQLRGILLSTMATSLGKASAPFLDMAANQELMAGQVKGGIKSAFEKYGLALDEFNVTSLNLSNDVQQSACPGCGAPVKFKSAASVMAVCEFCKTTLLKDAQAVSNLGKMSEVLEDYSPLQIGTSGQFAQRSFSLIGRIQLQYSAGFWNEWYALFAARTPRCLSHPPAQFTIPFPNQTQPP